MSGALASGQRVAVVGAGLAGVCTAWELAQRGCAVTVFERSGSIAERASFAGAAVTLPAAPGLLPAQPKSSLAWRWQQWRANRQGSGGFPAAWTALSLAGLETLASLRRELSLEDESHPGLLVLAASSSEHKALEAHASAWAELGVAATWLNAESARRLEPGLARDAKLAGALAVAAAGAGNGRLFAQALRGHAQRAGVNFRFHTTVEGLAGGTPVQLRHRYDPPPEPATGVRQRRDAADTLSAPPGEQVEDFEAVVLCAGSEGLRLAGLTTPMALWRELSVTLPLRVLEAHPELGPQSAVIDAARGCAIARIGQRVRVAGRHALVSASERAPGPEDFELLHRALQAWFPGSGQHAQAVHWHGVRAVVPDGAPLLGRTAQTGIWLHNAATDWGWGFACGAAAYLADSIVGRTSAVDAAALDVQRLR
ncbi:NAD(P)/FAD-dependent oxidoreductase [Roseateles paludis]|uniref:FAD-dependent oxidoreductase n=1 Tax=Roseateles paludis TaxID=3145238 RepID=A0ABV0G4Z6_9BURK